MIDSGVIYVYNPQYQTRLTVFYPVLSQKARRKKSRLSRVSRGDENKEIY